MAGKEIDFQEIEDYLNSFLGIPDNRIGRSYREVILKVTGGDSDKLRKLKEQMREMLDTMDEISNQNP